MITTVIALALLALLAIGDVPNDSEHVDGIRAVMFEFDYDVHANIRHAQAVGGYSSMETCQGAMPVVMGEFVNELGPDRTPQLICSSIKERVVIGTAPKVKT